MSATLSVSLGLDSTLAITLPSGRIVSLTAQDAGPALLDILHSHDHCPTPKPQLWFERLGDKPVRKFDARGQRQVTLADLGL